MSSLFFSQRHVSALKRSLRDEFPEVRSSHLSEALAAALGFRTYASMLSQLPPPGTEHDFLLLDDAAFDMRLRVLGNLPQEDFSFEWIEAPVLIQTRCDHAWDIDYKSSRDRAWRNIVVAATNEGLRRRLFSLKPDDNKWNGWAAQRSSAYVSGTIFDFALAEDLPAKVYVADAGYGELAINVAICPTRQSDDFVRSFKGGFLAGDAFAATWLERERGAWIQSSTSSFKCRRHLLQRLTELHIPPAGYGDRGRVIM